MAKQNVFNFKTMQFELVECDDLLSLIDDMNAECAAQHRVHWTLRLLAWLKNKIGLGLRQ